MGQYDSGQELLAETGCRHNREVAPSVIATRVSSMATNHSSELVGETFQKVRRGHTWNAELLRVKCERPA